MYGRRLDPGTRTDAAFSVCAVLLFAWLLIAIGQLKADPATYLLLIAATLMLAAALYRQRH